jgi:hypothetical protein
MQHVMHTLHRWINAAAWGGGGGRMQLLAYSDTDRQGNKRVDDVLERRP